MTCVDGAHVFEPALEDRLDEMVNPVRGDAPQVTVHDSADLCPEGLHRLEDRPKSRALSTGAPVYRYDLLLPGLDLELLRHFAGVVRRPTVGDEDDGSEFLVVLVQTVGYHLDDVLDRLFIVVTRDAHNDVGPLDLFDPFKWIISQG